MAESKCGNTDKLVKRKTDAKILDPGPLAAVGSKNHTVNLRIVNELLWSRKVSKNVKGSALSSHYAAESLSAQGCPTKLGNQGLPPSLADRSERHFLPGSGTEDTPAREQQIHSRAGQQMGSPQERAE